MSAVTPAAPQPKIRVQVVMPTENCHGNILWPGRFAARNGRFPADHPAAPGANLFVRGDGQLGESPALRAFCERGHWASCFPEGDGIVFKTEAPREQVERDVAECFGFEVRR